MDYVFQVSPQDMGGERSGGKVKQRRLQGACDICRQKKVRCDSAKMPGQRCSNCIAFGADCTHFHLTKKTTYNFGSMGGAIPAHILKALDWVEAKAQMNPLLNLVLTSSYQPPTNPALIRETMSSLAQYARLLETALTSSLSPARSAATSATTPGPSAPDSLRASPFTTSNPPTASTGASKAGQVLPSGGDDDAPVDDSKLKEVSSNALLMDDISALSDNLRRSLVLDTTGCRFFGPSSSVMVVKTALDLSQKGTESTEQSVARHRRPEYWTVRPWEVTVQPDYPPYDFPEPSFLEYLVDVYFTHVNDFVPILHRPTIESGLASGLHLSDEGFGGVVLAICAIAGQYSKDPRVLLDENNNPHSGGHKWYRQLRLSDDNTQCGPSLYGLQTRMLAIMYLRATSRPEKCWYLLGSALRGAQDIGYNRKKPNRTNANPSVGSELRKRLFFGLVIVEAITTAMMGRPRSLSPCDYDLDPPIECDDEYWENEDPELRFKQPPGKPSKVTFFVHLLKLFGIFGEAQIAFYPVKKPTPPKGTEPEEWNAQQLMEFDSKMNRWVDTIPEHLHWDPHQAEVLWLNQSAMLHAMFYWIQILIHRPFIGSRNRVTLSYTSHTICTNAARACSRIMDTQRRKGGIAMAHVHTSVFMSGIILLLNIWRAKTAGIPMDERRDMENVSNCLKVLRTCELGWHSSGRYSDVLYALSTISGQEMGRDGNLQPSLGPTQPLPHQQHQRQQTHTRNLDMAPQPSAALPNPFGGTVPSAVGPSPQVPVPAVPHPEPDRHLDLDLDIPMYIADLSLPTFTLGRDHSAGGAISDAQRESFMVAPDAFVMPGYNRMFGTTGQGTGDAMQQAAASSPLSGMALGSMYGGNEGMMGDSSSGSGSYQAGLSMSGGQGGQGELVGGQNNTIGGMDWMQDFNKLWGQVPAGGFDWSEWGSMPYIQPGGLDFESAPLNVEQRQL